MTLREIARIENLMHRQEHWSDDANHISDRMHSKHITAADVLDVLKTGYVIEVNHTADLCVTMRKDYEDRSVCVVVNLPTRFVVTSWINRTDDVHYTLDMHKYRWRVNLLEELREF